MLRPGDWLDRGGWKLGTGRHTTISDNYGYRLAWGPGEDCLYAANRISCHHKVACHVLVVREVNTILYMGNKVILKN